MVQCSTVREKKKRTKVNCDISVAICRTANGFFLDISTKYQLFFGKIFGARARASSQFLRFCHLWFFEKVVKMYPWGQKLKKKYFNLLRLSQVSVSDVRTLIGYFYKKNFFARARQKKFFSKKKISNLTQFYTKKTRIFWIFYFFFLIFCFFPFQFYYFACKSLY